MPVAAENTEAIINAIRVLRSRRVRPSGEKIAWYLKRHKSIDEETTVEALDGMVRSCEIYWVEYRGAMSYRVTKSLRTSKSTSKAPALDGPSVRRAIISAVANCGITGGSRHRIAACLQTRGLAKLVDRLDVILQTETRVGSLTKKIRSTEDGSSVTLYSVGSRAEDTNGEDRSSSTTTDDTYDAEDDKTRAPFEHLQLQLKLLQEQKNGTEAGGNINSDNDSEEEQKCMLEDSCKSNRISKFSKRGRPKKYPEEVKEQVPKKKKGRPPSKRAKKEKKVYDPSEEDSLKKRQNESSSFDLSPLFSDICSVCNTNEEDLLCCKLCSTKAHPKCIGYGEELASKVLKTPWSCMDCKSCSICKFNHRIGALIFCDKCDRAFHQTCHFPPLSEFPIGPWVCFICMPRVEGNVYDSLVPFIPTPVTSPESNENAVDPIESIKSEVPNAANWDVDSVAEYFEKNGLEDFATVVKDQEIDGYSLMVLSRSDVVYGLGLKLGPALRMYGEVRVLQTRLRSPPF